MVDWSELRALAGRDLHEAREEDVETIVAAVRTLHEAGAWSELVELRELFAGVVAGQAVTVGTLGRLRDELEAAAIQAAGALADPGTQGRFHFDRGHFLHQVGFHQEAIDAFDEAARLHRRAGDAGSALRALHMTALCLRALGRHAAAERVVDAVIEQAGESAWRAHPRQVKAWLLTDRGDQAGAERLLREALELHRAGDAPDHGDMLADVQADLAELLAATGRLAEAREAFRESLELLDSRPEPFDRLRAQTVRKYAAMVSATGDQRAALELLIPEERRSAVYTDLLWKIELVLAAVYWRAGAPGLALLKVTLALGMRRRLGLRNAPLAVTAIRGVAGRAWRAVRRTGAGRPSRTG